MALFLGVDVGSESVRAVVVDAVGNVLSKKSSPISVFSVERKPNFAEQSSSEIWHACGAAVQAALAELEAGDAQSSVRERVRGIGFTSTCSTLLLDARCEPLCISPTGIPERDVIMWKDHRAAAQAQAARSCSDTRRPSAASVDGPDPFWLTAERPATKLLWMRENMAAAYSATEHVLDLSDWLVLKATGATDPFPRSLCALTAKFNYRHTDGVVSSRQQPMSVTGWPEAMYARAGLPEMCGEGFRRLGTSTQQPGTPVGRGLCRASADALGLRAGTPVGASLIDAHAGALAVLGVRLDGAPVADGNQDGGDGSFGGRAALICGTSACLMVGQRCGPRACYVMPGGWLDESGQSAVGDLLQHLVTSHPASARFRDDGGGGGGCGDVFDRLNDYVVRLGGERDWPLLAADVHVLPDFRGNRAPLGDDALRGVVSGLTLDAGPESLARLYVAALLSLALGVRFILDARRRRQDDGDGHVVAVPTALITCGGVALKNRLYLEAHADALMPLPVAVVDEPEAVALGAAMLGAAAAAEDRDLADAMRQMAPRATLVEGTGHVGFMTRKYAVYLGLLEEQRRHRHLMCADAGTDEVLGSVEESLSRLLKT